MIIEENSCCFLGHREICETQALKSKLYKTVEKLIVDQNVDTFFFGSKSRFNTMCYEIVSQLKEKYSHINRIYVRAEFPIINEDYKSYLLESFEDTFYPDGVVGAGRAVYIKRNTNMIDNSRFCIFYCQEDYAPKGRKSGTKIALEYAMKRGKDIIILP